MDNVTVRETYDGSVWRVCYSVRSNGSLREMPPARNMTRPQAIAHADRLRDMGYLVRSISPDTCG